MHKCCNAFCDGTSNARHFTVEDGNACKCFEHLHTFHCDEEEGAPLVRVHCHHTLQGGNAFNGGVDSVMFRVSHGRFLRSCCRPCTGWNQA